MTDQFDYQTLVDPPPLFGFFAGWFVQRLDTLVQQALLSDQGEEPFGDWERARNEICRLARLLRDWQVHHERGLPKDLVHDPKELVRALGPNGIRDSVVAKRRASELLPIRESAEWSIAHELELRYFPDVLAEPEYAQGEFRTIAETVRRLIPALGELCDTSPAVEAGASVAGIGYCLASSATGSIWQHLNALAELRLLPPPQPAPPAGTPAEDEPSIEHPPGTVYANHGPADPAIDMADLVRRQRAVDGMIDEEMLFHKALAQLIPRLICAHLEQEEPPLHSDVPQFPSDLKTQPDNPWPPIESLGSERYLVQGQEKQLTVGMDEVIQALIDAGPEGLKLPALKGVRASGRDMLKELRKDPDWASIVKMPEVKGRRYRLVFPE